MNQLIKYLIAVTFTASFSLSKAGTLSSTGGSKSAEPVMIFKEGQKNYLQVNVNFTLQQAQYYILDANRSIVGGGKFTPYKNTILLDQFPSGAYTVKIKNGDVLAVKQFTLR